MIQHIITSEQRTNLIERWVSIVSMRDELNTALFRARQAALVDRQSHWLADDIKYYERELQHTHARLSGYEEGLRFALSDDVFEVIKQDTRLRELWAPVKNTAHLAADEAADAPITVDLLETTTLFRDYFANAMPATTEEPVLPARQRRVEMDTAATVSTQDGLSLIELRHEEAAATYPQFANALRVDAETCSITLEPPNGYFLSLSAIENDRDLFNEADRLAYGWEDMDTALDTTLRRFWLSLPSDETIGMTNLARVRHLLAARRYPQWYPHMTVTETEAYVELHGSPHHIHAEFNALNDIACSMDRIEEGNDRFRHYRFHLPLGYGDAPVPTTMNVPPLEALHDNLPF